MKKSLFLLALSALLLLGFNGPDGSAVSYSGNTTDTFKLTVNGADYKINCIYDEYGFPSLYCIDIAQYPCKEKICYMMYVRLYWDMWGNYLKMDLSQDKPLTKIGHEPFSQKDYQRLHKLLNNPESFIRYYELDELNSVQSEDRYYSLDAITGATMTNVKYESVRGAVKTCYSLWKIINSELRNDLLVNTISKSESILHQSITSDTISFINSIQQKSNGFTKQACSIEIARRTKIDDIKLKELSDQLNQNNQLTQLLIYNFLLQRNYKDKSVRQFDLKIE